MRWMLLVGLAACSPVKGNVPGDGAPPDDAPEVGRELVVESRATLIRNVDVLLVVDDSSTMATKQKALSDNFAQFVNALSALPGGLPDLHLGVITTDMGTKGSGSATPGPSIGSVGQGGCANVGKGGNLTVGTATGITGNFVSDIKLSDGSRQTNYGGSLAQVVAEMVTVGATGCGFEQPLHAVRVALNNNSQNAGFLRTDALLAVLFLTDEDDCSLNNTAMLGPPSATLGDLTSFRCTRFGVTCAGGGTSSDEMNMVGTKTDCRDNTSPGAFLDPVAGFHDFLIGLKSDPSQVMVSGIIGPPTPVTVENVPPPTGGPALPALAHSCNRVVDGVASPGDPGVRMQTFLDLFPNRSTSTSVCQDDYAEALDSAASLISQSAGSPCVSKPLFDSDAATAGLQADCLVDDTLGANVTLIDQCDVNNIATCWRLVDDAIMCPLFDHLRLEVVRDGPLPPDTITRARCRVQ